MGLVSCPKGQWTKVATAVSAGTVKISDNSPHIIYKAWRNSGDSSPHGNNQPIIFKIIVNATITGASYTDVEPGISPLQVDTTATGYTGGQEIYFTTLKNDGDKELDLGSLLDNFKIWRRQTITLAVDKSSGSTASSVIGFSFRSRV